MTSTDLTTTGGGALANPDAIATAITQIDNAADAKDMVDWTATLHVLAKKRTDCLKEQNRYAVLKLAAERKAGEILASMQLSVGARAPARVGNGTMPAPAIMGPTLKELGINATQSSRWQRLASIPLEMFEAHLQHQAWEGIEITQSAALRLAGTTKRGSQQRRTVDAIGVIEDPDATVEDVTHLAAAALVRLTPWSYEDARHLVGMLAAAGERGVAGESVIRAVNGTMHARAAADVDRWQ